MIDMECKCSQLVNRPRQCPASPFVASLWWAWSCDTSSDMCQRLLRIFDDIICNKELIESLRVQKNLARLHDLELLSQINFHYPTILILAFLNWISLWQLRTLNCRLKG